MSSVMDWVWLLLGAWIAYSFVGVLVWLPIAWVSRRAMKEKFQELHPAIQQNRVDELWKPGLAPMLVVAFWPVVLVLIVLIAPPLFFYGLLTKKRGAVRKGGS